ncbi:MAG: prolipoprotein diacylglyceryl transferase [Candidatus Omnitrophica bacterium]|jgi:phosphatidylglycerol:prolipoprotein diacylglycerol transferase|nr:prolipoprotein diacylglyceryl transferase [Candidatus Omnitrophota bacterium]
MHPIICQIGPFTIYSYGLMMVVAFLTAVSLACRQAKKQGIDPNIIYNLCFYSFIAGILGARIFFVVEHFRDYLAEPLEIIMLQHGGMSWFGGFTAGSLTALYYVKRNKLRIYTVLDLLAPFLALGHAIGRLGCFLNGCCYGRENKIWGMYFPAHDAFLIPTQLYSSIILFALFLFLKNLQDKPHRQGQVFLWYLLLYSTKRFFMEFLRADNPHFFYGLSLFQIISAGFFIFACLKLIQLNKR